MRDQVQQTAFGRYIVIPIWDAIWRLSQPDVRMVTGGIAFYALFSIFPLAYLTTALLFTLLPPELSGQLALAVNQIVASNIMPLEADDLSSVASLAPQSFTLSIILTLILVIWAAMAGTKATITGIRMIAGSTRPSGVIRFQGISLMLAGLLILLVWTLGASQIVLTIIRSQDGGPAVQFAQRFAAIADTIWISKWVASFLVFFLLIWGSLQGRIRGWPMAFGAAVSASAWMLITYGFQIYLSYSVLDTIYGALASIILGFIWLSLSINALLIGAALATEWDTLYTEDHPETGSL